MPEYLNTEVERRFVSALLGSKKAVEDTIKLYRSAKGKEWFSSKEIKYIVDKIYKYYESTGAVPTRQYLVIEVKTEAQQKPEEDQQPIIEKYEILIERITSLSVEAHEAEPLARKLLQIYVNRASAESAIQYAALIEEDKTTDAIKYIEEEVAKLKNLGSSTDITLSEDVYDIESDLDYIKDRRENPQNYIGIPTGIREFDRETQGIHKDEMGLIVGRTSGGKTMLCVEIGYNALLAGANVAHFAPEGGLRLTKFRYNSRVSQIDYKKFKHADITDEEIGEWKEHLSRIKSGNGALKIFAVNDNFSPNQIEPMISNYYGSWRPDLVIVDGLNLMVPNGGNKSVTGDRLDWKTQTIIAIQLLYTFTFMENQEGGRGVGAWCSSQAPPQYGKRQQDYNSILSTDIGMGGHIATPFHYVLHIIRTEEMALNRQAVLKFTKMRDSDAINPIPVKTDFKRCTFIKMSIDDDIGTEVEGF